MAVNEQFPTLMPKLYPGSKAMDPKPYASFDAMWKAFNDLAHNKTSAANVKELFCPACFVERSAVVRPVRAPAAGYGHGPGRVPSQSPSRQAGSSHNPVSSTLMMTLG